MNYKNSTLRDTLKTQEAHLLESIATYQEEFILLEKIYACLLNVNNQKIISEKFDIPARLLSRTASLYLSSIKLAFTGQSHDAYSTLRSSLEYAVYSISFSLNPELQDLWINKSSRKKEFREK